jgi:SsrA-binding protein
MSTKKIAENRKAYHEYFIIETIEAGMVLQGTEIKSIRKGQVQFKDAYVHFHQGEAFIRDMHIAHYEQGNQFNHDETRERKLLLHKEEIRKLQKKAVLKGYTVIPLTLNLVNGRAKLELALAQGKALHDKRESEKKRDAQREMAKVTKHYR